MTAKNTPEFDIVAANRIMDDYDIADGETRDLIFYIISNLTVEPAQVEGKLMLLADQASRKIQNAETSEAGIENLRGKLDALVQRIDELADDEAEIEDLDLKALFASFLSD